MPWRRDRGAVTEFGREQNQTTLDAEVARAGYLAHETRNLVNTAIVAFEVLKTGNVGVAGSTGSVLQRSLMGLRALASRSLAEVRLTQGVQNREQFLVSEFIAELASAATLDARSRGVTLTVLPVEDGVSIEADRHILAAVLTNVLQNAFKFSALTRPSRCGSAPAPNACSSRCRTSVADSQAGMLTNCSARSSSAEPIEPAWASVSRSADGP
jgi:signal transduction histidine kinase